MDTPSSDLIKLFGSLLSIVLGAGVIGLWRMSNMVAAMQATIANWQVMFERVSAEQHTHGERIARLETNSKVHALLIERFVHPARTEPTAD
jgi:alanine dehydrogenase